MKRARFAQGTDVVLLELLAADLRAGHHNVAIRHFAMLQKLGAPVPLELQVRCEGLVRACPPGRLARTLRSVEDWAAMLTL